VGYCLLSRSLEPEATKSLANTLVPRGAWAGKPSAEMETPSPENKQTNKKQILEFIQDQALTYSRAGKRKPPG
jgi:hypothetical protein